jgi:hypothetical protein
MRHSGLPQAPTNLIHTPLLSYLALSLTTHSGGLDPNLHPAIKKNTQNRSIAASKAEKNSNRPVKDVLT